MAWLNEEQSEINYRFRAMKDGPHIILLNYFTPKGDSKVCINMVHQPDWEFDFKTLNLYTIMLHTNASTLIV